MPVSKQHWTHFSVVAAAVHINVGVRQSDRECKINSTQNYCSVNLAPKEKDILLLDVVWIESERLDMIFIYLQWKIKKNTKNIAYIYC